MNVTMVKMPVRLPRTFVNYPTFSGLGLLQNAAVIERAGHKTRVVDAMFLSPNLLMREEDGCIILGDDTPAFYESVLEGDPDAVVIGNDMFCDLDGYSGAVLKKLLTAVKRRRPGAVTVLADCYTGGTDYFKYDPAVVRDKFGGLDLVLTGETEASLAALLGGAPPSAFKRLDDLPPPAYHLLDMENYFQVVAAAVSRDLVHEFKEPARMLALQTSRGCPYSCTFCASILHGAGYRAHSSGHVTKMLDMFRERYRVERFVFLDDAMNIDTKRFGRICRHLAMRGIGWDAVNGLRADRVSRRDMQMMAAAGNRSLAVSAESGDQRVCDVIIGKGLDPGAVEKAARNASETGLALQIHYMIGIPGETAADMNRTLGHAALMAERYNARPLMQFATPVPGTPMERTCREKGWLAGDYNGADLRGAFAGRSFIRTPEFDPELLYRLRARFDRRVAAGRDALLMLDPGYVCNSSCTYCCTAVFRGKTMGLEDAVAMVLAARRSGILRVDIGGGEPTLLPWLTDLIRACVKMGMRETGLVTNGRMLAYPRFAAQIITAGVTRVSVTLNGPDAGSHDRMARVRGAFGQTMAGVRNMVSAGFENIHFNVVACRSNLAVLDRTVALAGTFSAAPVNLQPAFPMGAALSGREFVDSYGEMEQAVRKVMDSVPGTAVRVHNLPFCVMPDCEGMLVESSGVSGRRMRLPGGGVRSFAGVVNAMKTKPWFCEGCEYDVICGGVWKKIARQSGWLDKTPRST
ncbi:MAG: radical SAM protein [Myxococcota bacterium]|jgi:MoaA/NifB/PqqE/SkfB family radical SAM enzyme